MKIAPRKCNRNQKISLQTVVRTHLAKIEATRAYSNSSNTKNTKDSSSEKPPTIETPVQDYSQGYTSLKRIEPYSREECQSQAEQTNSQYWSQNFHWPQDYQGFPQNNQCCPQKEGEATRADLKSSNIENTNSYSTDSYLEKLTTLETPVQDNSQGYPSLKRIEPYSREGCQSQVEQTNSQYWSQNSHWPQVYQGFPQNNQCCPQKEVEATRANSNSSNTKKTRSYSNDSSSEKPPMIETQVQDNSQRYPSLKSDKPYSKEECQSQAEQTNSHYWSQNSHWPQVYQGFPQNNQCCTQKGVEATRADFNSSNIENTNSYSTDSYLEKLPTIETPVQNYSQGYPSLKCVEPYSKEECQSQTEQTNSQYWFQNSHWPQVYQGFPQNNQCCPQKEFEASRADFNSSNIENTNSYSTDSYLEKLPTIETQGQVYTHGYPSLKRVNLYSRELYQSQTELTNNQYYSQNSQWSQVCQGLPKNYQCWPQNNEWPPLQPGQISQYCCGYYSSTPPGGKQPPPNPCCPPCPYPTCQNPCSPPPCPPQPCPPQPCTPQPCCYPCCSRCGPCSPNGNWCIPQVDCCGKRIVPPPECRPGPVPPNPCCPQYPKKGVFRIYRSIFLFICLPIIILQLLNVLSHERCPKIHCREYEFMRRRTKRFPWGDGDKTLFHNDEVNHLPSECEPPPTICEEIEP